MRGLVLRDVAMSSCKLLALRRLDDAEYPSGKADPGDIADSPVSDCSSRNANEPEAGSVMQGIVMFSTMFQSVARVQ